MKVVSCGLGFTFALSLEIYYFNVLKHSHPHARLIIIYLQILSVYEDLFTPVTKLLSPAAQDKPLP